MKKLILISLFLPLLLTACSDDDYVYPNVLTEMLDLKTDDTGTVRYLITDEGVQWDVVPIEKLSGLATDSIYRTVTMYAPVNSPETSTPTAQLYQVQQAVAFVPQVKDKFKKIYTDPVNLQSIWRGGNYLNLILRVMVKDQTHDYHFIDNGVTLNEDGKRTLHLTLYHNRHNDVEGFNRKVYLSVPLWAYADVLQKGDEIIFTLNTYKEGMTSRSFTY